MNVVAWGVGTSVPRALRCTKAPAIVPALQVASDDAVAMARRLALEEGLLVGISSGAAVKVRLACRPWWSCGACHVNTSRKGS